MMEETMEITETKEEEEEEEEEEWIEYDGCGPATWFGLILNSTSWWL